MLVARYFIATLPFVEKKVAVDGRRKYATTSKSDAQKDDLRSLRLLEKELSGETGELDEKRYTLGVLRGSRSRFIWDF